MVIHFTPFRLDTEIKIDQINFRRKGQDEWSYFSKIFSHEDDYNHVIENNEEIDENLIIIYYKLYNPIEISSEFVQIRVIIDNAIYKCDGSIEWVKIEDQLIPRMEINPNLRFEKEKIKCLSLQLNKGCLRFLEQFNQIIDTQEIKYLREIRSLNIKSFDIVLIYAKYIEDIKLYSSYIKDISQILLSDGDENFIDNCIDINKNNASYLFYSHLLQFLKRKCLNIEKNDIVDFWETNKTKTERFWQKYLKKQTEIFSLALNYTIEFICDEGILQGQDLFGKGEKRIDFLYTGKDGKAILIEIKGPKTKLLREREYRNGIYPPTIDLSGSTLQVMAYKNILIENYDEIIKKSNLTDLNVENIKCYVIIGNFEDLKEEQVKSFLLFKEIISPYVEIITFDDLFDRYKRSFLK